MNIDVILYLAAAICFGLAAFGIGGKVNLIALGLCLWVLTNIV